MVVLAVAAVDPAIGFAVAAPVTLAAPFVALWVVRRETTDVRAPWRLLASAMAAGLLAQLLQLLHDAGVGTAAFLGGFVSAVAYLLVIRALITIDRLRGADGFLAGVDAITAAAAAMVIAWRVGIDAGTSVGAIVEACLWLALSLTAVVLVARLLATGLWRLTAMRLMTVGLVATLAADLMWFAEVIDRVELAAEHTAVLYAVATLCVLAAVVHPTGALLVTSGTVDRRTSTFPVLGLLASLVVVASLSVGRPVGALETAVTGVLAGAVMLGVGLQVAVRDRALRRAHDRLALRVDYDDLTGLLNRNGIRRRLDVALTVMRTERRQIAVAFIDLDRFSVVNDGLGHDIGDEVLVAIGARLARGLGPWQAVGRLGGDEFLLLLPGEDEDSASEIVDELLERCSSPIATSAGAVQISASAGLVVIGPEASTGLGDAIRSADLAMYRAKREGRSRLALFDLELASSITRRHDIEQALRQQLDSGHLLLRQHYQPIVDPADGALAGFEALARWDDPVLGPVTPDEFIPVAEETGLITQIGRWAVVEAIGQLRRLRALSGADHLRLSVNVSGRQLSDPGFVGFVATALTDAGLPPRALTLELTESSLIDHAAEDGRVIDDLRTLGCGLAVDDFGTGYSSLAYLARMPVTAVKIDRSFVEGLGSSGSRGRPVVEAVVQLARSFGLRVIAEGVEEIEQARRLTELGVERAQGWLWSPAVSADEAVAMVRAYSPSPPIVPATTVSFSAASTHEAVSSNDEAHMNRRSRISR